MAALMRHERMSRSGGGSSAGFGYSNVSAVGEDKERRLLFDAVKDGVILCL